MAFKPIILFSKVHKVHKIRVVTFKNSNEKKKTLHRRLARDSNPIAIDTLQKTTYVDGNYISVVFLHISCRICLFQYRLFSGRALGHFSYELIKQPYHGKGSEALTFI